MGKNMVLQLLLLIEAHKINDRDRGHYTGNCEFQVNAYRWKTDNQVHISKICSQHNHALVENIGIIAPSYRKLTSEMCDDVRLLASSGVRPSAIIEVLQRKNPGKYIHQRNIYNLIQTIRHQKGVISDAGSMYLTLLKQQQDNPTFHVDACFEGQDNHLYHGEKWNKFFAAFCCARNSRIEPIFEQEWAILLQEYSDAADYLKWQLYECREAWALCFIHCAFNAGVQSTQHVESYNAIIKKNVNESSSLLELERTIEKLLTKESHFVHLNETINKLPISQEEKYCDRYFQRVDKICNKFLTPAILKLQRSEMNRSMHYRCHIASLEDELGQQSVLNHQKSSPTKPSAQIDFSHLESIRRCHIFTDEVQHKLTRKQQWGKGFGLMKKTLDLAIATGRAEELYELHLNLSKKMEIEIATKEDQLVEQNDDKNNFISTIIDESDKDSDYSEKLPDSSLDEVLNTQASSSRQCGICRQRGHNVRTCSNREVAVYIE
ncbi:7752_t:CDS:2 [Cetraspora pellucida]|uniref:7752_t:CDS:1 n=1 Tax=Cetraspora pellucida TaxID=1433469 RepID=A0ACA9NUN0_9GLOM|nr:7752_t:CDS:2 [Cetraspora pellucida]